MSDAIDYPREYDNSGRVANAQDLIDTYIMDAAFFREQDGLNADLDLSYGPNPRNKMDLFWPRTEEGKARKSPLVVFIHGGYWQRLDRSTFSHMASGLNGHGIAVALPSYTLCPDISIEGIIKEMRRACLMLFQTYKRPLTVIGHSAGGHLAACMLATDWEAIHESLPHDLVASGMGISGLYDLTPLLKTPVNDEIGMDDESAAAASPIRWVPEALQQFDAWVGADESDEYHRQSRDLAATWSLLGTPTTYVSQAGDNHFTVINTLTDPESAMVKRIVELSEKPAAKFELIDTEEAVVDDTANVVKDEKRDTKNAETDSAEAPDTREEQAAETQPKSKTAPSAHKPAKPRRKSVTSQIIAKGLVGKNVAKKAGKVTGSKKSKNGNSKKSGTDNTEKAKASKPTATKPE